MALILYADDEPRYRQLIGRFLEQEGHRVLTAIHGREALETYAAHPETALVILDVMMPVMDGRECCRRIRERSPVPILMLTALGDEDSEVAGFGCGASDYIAKPFRRRVFMARVRALLGRNAGGEEPVLTSGAIALDDAAREARVGEAQLDLTPREFALLRFLLKNPGVAFSRERLIDRVWGMDWNGDRRTVDTHMKSLRAKLGEEGERIETVRGVGYLFREDRP